MVRIHLAWLLDRFRPGIVLYDAGVDPHKDDVLGKLNLTDQGTKKIKQYQFNIIYTLNISLEHN